MRRRTIRYRLMARLFTIDKRGWEAPCDRLERSERARKLQANSVEFISALQNGLNIDDILYPFERFGEGIPHGLLLWMIVAFCFPILSSENEIAAVYNHSAIEIYPLD